MTDYQAAAERYIAAWNTAGNDRAAAVARAFTGDASYIDPMMTAAGHAGLDAMIGGAQQKFAGLHFYLAGAVDGHGDRLRFCWSLGADAATPVAKGTDFATLGADGRIAQVCGFLDLLPQSA